MHNHVSQLGIHLISMMIHFHESCQSFESFKRIHCPLLHCVSILSSHAAKSFCRAAQCSKGNLKNFYLCSLHSLCVSIFELVIWLLHSYHSRTMFRVLCHWCGTHHGPPSMRLFSSTLAHHLGTSLRNKKLVPWDLYALMTDPHAFNKGSHHWYLIERLNWVFNIKSSIHT